MTAPVAHTFQRREPSCGQSGQNVRFQVLQLQAISLPRIFCRGAKEREGSGTKKFDFDPDLFLTALRAAIYWIFSLLTVSSDSSLQRMGCADVFGCQTWVYGSKRCCWQRQL